MEQNVSLFSPDGLLLTNDDAFRKFGGAIVLARHTISATTEEIVPTRIDAMRRPVISCSTQRRGSFEVPDSAIRLVRGWPQSGVSNYKNGILRGARTGERQWQVGLGSTGYSVAYETDKTEYIHAPGFQIADALFFPKYTPLEEALEQLGKTDVKARAINQNFWVKQLLFSKNSFQNILYRKTICVGVFHTSKKDSFYFQSGCSAFKDDVAEILEGK